MLNQINKLKFKLESLHSNSDNSTTLDNKSESSYLKSEFVEIDEPITLNITQDSTDVPSDIFQCKDNKLTVKKGQFIWYAGCTKGNMRSTHEYFILDPNSKIAISVFTKDVKWNLDRFNKIPTISANQYRYLSKLGYDLISHDK